MEATVGGGEAAVGVGEATVTAPPEPPEFLMFSFDRCPGCMRLMEPWDLAKIMLGTHACSKCNYYGDRAAFYTPEPVARKRPALNTLRMRAPRRARKASHP